MDAATTPVFALPPDVFPEEVMRALGVTLDGRPIKKRIVRLADEVAEAVRLHAKPRIAVREFGPARLLSLFPRSSFLTRQMDPASVAATVAGTVGAEFQKFCVNHPDPWFRHALSAGATALARRLLKDSQILLENRHPGLTAGAVLSPGNGGLPLRFQRTLFELLPPKIAGITFDSETLAMQPLASVSGIVGVGAYTRRTGSPCRTCPSGSCGLREEPFAQAPRNSLTEAKS